MQNAPREHSAVLLTCIKRLSVLKTYILVFFRDNTNGIWHKWGKLNLKNYRKLNLSTHKAPLLFAAEHFFREKNLGGKYGFIFGHWLERNLCSGGVTNNKDADQLWHPCNLISAFVIRSFLKVSYLDFLRAKFQISTVVSVAEETGLSFNLSETPKTGFDGRGPFHVNFLTWHMNLSNVICCSMCWCFKA